MRTNQRAAVLALLSVPAISGIAEVAIRAARHQPEQIVTRAHIRAVADPADARQLPTERLIEAAFSERDRERTNTSFPK